ncbi:hypothetical protein ACNAQ8_30100 [Pseudomonas aeruginosa]|uniref:hypothetical protein n=4 Tax=Pseudomonas TaxID=286 RepID=UPI0018C7A0E1|nr:hypothetical protein [Pseudomonas aeruginosa]EIU7098270.1 hypothetical protein [Pseudomonas aeruginosa]EIU7119595.1 hypothetical protein [Pseudomonas aeruginosa]EIU7131907.1 hypothetical protein [Pseudomonas aeruginosa]EKB4879024.1 hypothetical protein [Pseudomonas aeruginosa]EKE7664249.1 hypothetical protein [Pseudomonas aeruginosa]
MSLIAMPSNEAQFSVKPGTIKKNRTNDICIAYLQDKWREILTTRFDYFFQKSPESGQRMELIMNCMIQGLKSLFLNFSDLKDTQFNKQVMLDDVGIYSQRMAEMLFYYRLLGMGFEDIKSKDAGPDFVARKNGETFCFEVVTPTPQDHIRNLIKQRKLEPEDRDTVFRERLLSVTSAIKDKLKKFEDHKAAGHVPEAAHYIIVVNDSLLLPYDQPWYGVLGELCFGDSTLPIAVDATLGSGDIDFSDLLGEEPSGEDDVEFQSLVMRSSYGISVNGGEAQTPEDSLLRVKIRKKIPTRKSTDTVAVDIAESVGVTGIYQITLREDLMFYHSFKSGRSIMPASALISSVKNKQLVREAIFFTSKYAKDEALVQPYMSSARLFGYEPDEYNNLAVYNAFFKPVLEGGEFYQPLESKD